LDNLKSIYSSSLLQIKQSFGRPMFRFCVFVQPILYGIITYFMFKKSGMSDFVAYSILGTGLLSLWSTICFSSVGDINRERFMGTLEVISCAPTKFEIIIFGKVLGNTLWGAVSMLVSFLFITIVFRTSMVLVHPLIFTATFIVALISFIGISLVLASISTLSRKSGIFMNILEFPVYILCGILFPIEILPIWTRPLSWILSPTWVVKLLKMSIFGIENYEVYFKYLFFLIFIKIFYFILDRILFKEIDKKTRIYATLGVS
jgi:ABC-2 type transport system permease protein